MYKKLPIPKFYTSQWLRVKGFTDSIDTMNQDGVLITDNSILECMRKVLDSVDGEQTIDNIPVNILKKGFRALEKACKEKAMDDVWFEKEFGDIYKAVISMRKDEDYVINPSQMDKFLDLVNFFLKHTPEDGAVEIEKTSPKECFGGVTATFLVMTLRGDEVADFCNSLGCCSAISIDSCEDGACISCTVPDIFIKRN